MKTKDITEFETGHHCFGDILTVNGREYDDLSKEEVLEFILDMFENDINSANLIKDTFKNALEYLPFTCKDQNSYRCDQCGDYNDYIKWEK
jgi:hypothetical protein